MRLTERQIGAVRSAFGAEPLPEKSAGNARLRSVFGDHTFYAVDTGIIVWEWTVDAPEPPEAAAVAIKIAGWTDTEPRSLEPHEPRLTDLQLQLPVESGLSRERS